MQKIGLSAPLKRHLLRINRDWKAEGCLHNPSDESLDHYPRFLILQLRSAKSSCFKVGTRDLVFRRAWLACVPSA